MNVPTYLAVDRNGFILVVDHNNKRIVQLNAWLEFIRIFIPESWGLDGADRVYFHERRLYIEVYSFIKSQVTDRTCLQSKYKLYEIRPTGTARRLATQWVREQPCKKINRKRKLQLNTVSLLRWRHICHESFRCWWESIPGSLTWEAR